MAKLAAYPEPMNVEQFLAFNATRPDGEKWELLEGELFLNASPVHPHQRIVGNLVFHLGGSLRAAGRIHEAIPGIGVILSDISAVEPDVMIRKRDNLRGNICDDILVAFEVLSPSTRRNDLEFKRKGYANLATLTHYVVVSPEQIDVRVYARAANWMEIRHDEPRDIIDFADLGVALSLSEIYEDMDDILEPVQA